MLTKEYINECLTYEPNTGKFFWKKRPLEHFSSERQCKGFNTRYVGKEACHINYAGYLKVMIDHKTYRAHRLAWLITHGNWPKDQIDHIDRNRRNNRLANLREATQSQNLANSYQTTVTLEFEEFTKLRIAIRGSLRLWLVVELNI